MHLADARMRAAGWASRLRWWLAIIVMLSGAMPEGLLNPLTLEDIANLFAYLSYPPGTSVTSRRAEPVAGRK